MSPKFFAEIDNHNALVMRAADESRDIHGNIKDETLVARFEGHLQVAALDIP